MSYNPSSQFTAPWQSQAHQSAMSCGILPPLSSSSLPLCRTRGSHRPRAFEVGRNEKEKSCLSFQLVLFVPKEGGPGHEPWPTMGRLAGCIHVSITHPEGDDFLIFFIWSRDNSVQTFDGEIHLRTWEESSRGPLLAQHFHLIFIPEWFRSIRGNWVLPLPTVGNWRNDPVSLWGSNGDRKWDFRFIMQGRPCTHWWNVLFSHIPPLCFYLRFTTND